MHKNQNQQNQNQQNQNHQNVPPAWARRLRAASKAAFEARGGEPPLHGSGALT